jgi:hypothetical protein
MKQIVFAASLDAPLVSSEIYGCTKRERTQKMGATTVAAAGHTIGRENT